MDVGVYLPQVGFAWDDYRARVVACDREGIESIWLMDHLYPPGMPNVPSFEAWTAATALAAITESYVPLFLCWIPQAFIPLVASKSSQGHPAN